jgi:hypothetical protein
LVAVLIAVSGLLELAVGLIVQHLTTLGTVISDQDARTGASYYLAALIVGTPLWLGLWRVLRRRVQRSPDEQNALERRLFLAATFTVTSIVGLFALQALVESLLTLPAAVDQTAMAKNAVMAGAQLLTYGAAWLSYARLGWRERSPRSADLAHDLAVYMLAGFALIFLGIGLSDALRHLIMALQGTTEVIFDSNNVTWTVWGRVASFVVAGGAVWGAVWRYDLMRGGRRILRIAYLYAVLAVGVFLALIGAGDTLFELVRRAFGYQELYNNWSFLADSVPPIAVGAALWSYHWTVIRRQAAIFDHPVRVKGAIAWPRRPAIAALSLGGLAAAAVSFTSLLWLGIDWLLTTHGAVDGASWWRDQLSWSLATGVIGSAILLPAWTLLQRAATVDPDHERTAWERRWLLGAIMLASALATVSFTVATLYQVFRGILQTTDSKTLSDGLRYGSAAVIAAAVGVRHGVIVRRERQIRAPAPVRVHVAALITPGAEQTLAELERRTGKHLELLGYLAPDALGQMKELSALQEQLAALGSADGIDRALLILRVDGGVLYPYSRTERRITLPSHAIERPEVATPVD